MDSDKRKKRFPGQRSKRRVAVVSLIIFICTGVFLLWASHQQCEPTSVQQDGLPDGLKTLMTQRVDEVSFVNLNNGPHEASSHVLILTMIKPATVRYLANFFKMVRQLGYPNLSMALLVINPGPTTVHAVRQHIERARIVFPIKVYVKTYNDSVMTYVLTPGQEKLYELEPLRRAAVARARNYLLQSALTSAHDYTLWLDPLLESFPPTLVQDLMAVGEDIVVPNAMIRREDGGVWGYDKGNWQETEMSLSLYTEVPEDMVFLEGWVEFTTHHFLMIDMTDMVQKVPLDGIGSTCILTRANVHREGINFPAFPFQHHIDTEGFAKAANLAGYTVYGLPVYQVYHTGIPDNGLRDDSI